METSIENLDFVKSMKEHMGIADKDPITYSPLVLAYIGDAVYELVIRTYIVTKANMQVNKLHKATIDYVNAGKQSDISNKLLPILTEEEVGVFKRGRNAKSNTSAKNASITDYRRATGFEALIGYLYLKGDYDRLMELIEIGVKDEI